MPLSWPAAPEAAGRGHALLIHGLSSISGSWWQAGPAMARRGWDVVAVDQAGHGDRPAPDPLSTAALVDAVLAQHPRPPELLIGHSLGALTALAILERHPGWAGTVILEDPPGSLFAGPADLASAVATTVRADAVSVREDRPALERRVRADCPRWADEDVHWAVEGIARMDADAFAGWLDQLARHPEPSWRDLVRQITGTHPAPHVLAAVGDGSFMAGGSALGTADRQALEVRLPAGHVVRIQGGHCLHRDAFPAWLAAVDEITAGRRVVR